VCVWRLFGRGFAGSGLGVSEPEAVAIHFEDMDVMRQAIEERSGEPFGAEHGRPLIERQVMISNHCRKRDPTFKK
jgi:hypothetical protein